MISLQQAIEKIKEKEPVNGALFDCSESISGYSKNRIENHNFHPIHLERQKKYKGFIKKKIDKLFPKDELNINYDGGIISFIHTFYLINNLIICYSFGFLHQPCRNIISLSYQ